MSEPVLFVGSLRKNHRERLERAARKTRDAKFRDRCRAMLWSVQRCACSEIARRLGVHHTTVMRWIKDYQRFGFDGLKVDMGSGRPSKLGSVGEAVLKDALEKHPREFGYMRATWTAQLLRDHVSKTVHIHVHPETIRRALKRMRYRHKRPKLGLKHKQDQGDVRRARRRRNAALKKRPPTPTSISSSTKTNVSSISIPT